MCGEAMPDGAAAARKGGRAPVYCSAACRQRAYRERARDQRQAAPQARRAPRLDRFFGRERDLADLRQLLRGNRLLTLAGPPGVGKTRLADELTARVARGYPDGIRVVELGPVGHGDAVAQAVAAALDIRERPGEPLPETLQAVLRDRRLLLVLDSCEHLVDACAVLVEALLRRCSRLSVLATTREALHLPGEVVYQVAGLAAPDPAAGSAADLLNSEAVQLFLDRARDIDPTFALTDANQAHVGTVCARLDGLPLAIELAARTVRMLPVADLVARLDDRFSLLTSGPRTADRRHASLRAAIDWSHEQLSARERMALRRLSVLVGGFGLEAATAICAAAEVRASAVFELLTALADKSLIAPVPGSGDTARFRMLESVRLYGREKLAAADEEALAFDRLVDWLAARSKVVLDTPSVPTAMFEWVLVEHDNLSHALDWLAGTADERQLLLGGALAHARFERGNVGSSRMLLDRALESTPPDARYRGRVLVEAGWLAAWQGDMETAIRLFEDGVARQRARGLLRMVSWHLRGLGHVHTENGDRAAAIATLEEAVRVARQCGAHGNAAAALQNLAWDAVVHGEPDRAAKLMDEALPVILSSEPRRSQSAALHTAGTIAWMRGGFREAQEHFLASVDIRDTTTSLAFDIEGLALVAVATGRPERALRLLAAAGTLRRAYGREGEGPRWLGFVDKARAAARRALPADRADAAAAAGRRLSTAQTVAYAHSDVWVGPDATQPAASPLSAREYEVARLVAGGLTNGQIGAHLGVSVRTVEAHVRSVRAKLHVRSRTQIAGWMVRHAAGRPE